MAAGRGLELAGQVREVGVVQVAALDLLERGGGVDDLVGRDAGDRRAEERPRAVTARLQRWSSRRRRGAPRSPGTSSISIQWYWMFCRSLMSAVPRAYSVPMLPSARSWGAPSRAPSLRTRIMKKRSSSSSSSIDRRLAAVDARLALGVEAHPAEPAAEVGGVDRVETALGVGVEDPVPDVERVVVLLGLLVLVQGLACGPATTGPRRAWGGGSRSHGAAGSRSAGQACGGGVLR